MSEIREFKDLIVWRKAMVFTRQVYQLSQRFPPDERFGLTAQLRKSAISVPSNIAEGHARQGRDYAHFLSIARGSLAEAECQLLIAIELGFLPERDTIEVMSTISEVRRICIAISNKLT
jgi:four helix bundle protein